MFENFLDNLLVLNETHYLHSLTTFGAAKRINFL